MVSSRVYFCNIALLLLACPATAVTPMEKVITLLKGLSDKVTAEGKKEAAQYDKYACFCKEQASDKLYAIEKSDARIKSLKAKIKELDTAIAELTDDIGELSKRITKVKGIIDEKTKKRNKEHDEYLVKAKDHSEAIDACAAAIDALKDSKSSMKGAKTTNLVQVKKAISKLPSAVSFLEKLEGAPKFQYQSNDIIATLEDLLATFKEMKKDLDVEEFDINAKFESEKLGLSNEQKFKEKDRAEKEAIMADKSDELEDTKEQKDEEQKDRDADQEFLDVLTAQCEKTAELFDLRSKTRADELKALADATAELEKGAVPNFDANKKLVGLQKKSVVQKVKPVSFMQIVQHKHKQSDRADAVQKALAFLSDKATSSDSGVLSAVAMRVRVAEDHFVKVRGLIKDLVAKLEADAKAEASTKNYCDKNMAKALSNRDDAKGKIEAAQGKITTYTANQESLEAEVKDEEKQIAELKKELLEATELRADDKAENKETIEMSDEGGKSVKLALGILKDFYGGFVQTGKKYVPPKSDRSGNTVGDLAPEVFDSKYDGAGAESKGIIGILEVILSDFERTEKKATDDEKLSKEAFDELEKDTKEIIGKKDKKIEKMNEKITDLKADILEQQGAKSDAEEQLDSALAKLENLHSKCVAGEETWEERKKKREDEIAALKDALAILEDWQN